MKCFLSLCCLFVVTTALFAEKEHSTPLGPRIAFTETRHDFGTIDPQSLKWTFTFKNAGDKTLEIKNVQPGCGCTVIPDYDKSIEPGKEGKITAQLNTTTFKGHIEKGITVTSNDPKTPSVHLTLAADVKVDVAVLPQAAVWLKLQPTTVTNHTFEIRSTLAEPLVVEKVESSATWLTVAVTETTTNSAKIQVTTKPPIPAGVAKATVTARTKYEKYTNVAINVTSQVVPAISVRPSNLLFVKNKDWKASDLSIAVTRDDGKNFQILEIKPDSPQITGMVTTNEPGRKYRVNVTYLPKEGQGTTSGKLVIQTDDPTWSKLEIPYFFR